MTHASPTSPERASHGEPVGWSGLRHLVEEQDRSRLVLFLEGQSRVLAMIARGLPLPAVLDELSRVLEQQVEGMACSVQLVSEDRTRLRHCAGPSLSDALTRALDGMPIGPRACSGGTAAFLASPVIVTDIEHDPLWIEHRDAPLAAGFRACWSLPIVSPHGEVTGVFCMYHRQPFAPSSMHLSLVDLATHLARIAIEREEAERERLRLWDAKRFADRYLMVLKASSEAVWEWDLTSGHGFWNDGLSAFGYDLRVGERTLDWWTAHVHPDDVDQVRQGIETALASDQTQWEEECRFRRQDGTYASIAVHGLIVRDQAGKPVRIVGAFQDITRRKRHEQEIEQLAERLRSATMAGSIGTWRLDVKTERLVADASLHRLLGQEEEETVEQLGNALRAVHPEDRARVVGALDAAISMGHPFDTDLRVVLPDGEYRWLRCRGRVVYDPEGFPEFVTGAVADITELKHAEQSMAMLAEASRLLTESLDTEQILSCIARMAVPAFAEAVLVGLRDAHGPKLRVAAGHAANPELRTILEELGRASSVPQSSPARRVLRSGRAELQARLTPEWLVQEDVPELFAGLIQRFHISSLIHVPVSLGDDVVGLIAFAATGTRVYNERDLAFAEELGRRASTAMYNAQLFQAAKQERERAEEAAALRERLVAIVGHDLRSPLSAISMAAQLLSRRERDAANESLVNRISSSAGRMTRMIGQVLDFARIRAGMSFELDLQPIDVHQTCNAVADEQRLCKPDRPIDVVASGNGDVIGDADRISQALSNLVGNAVQHGTHGPVTVTVRDLPPDTVCIEVHNFGPPIPEAAQAGIFDAFRREATSEDRSSKSIGLGLYIASEVVRAHGGSISVHSPDRDGTTFKITLPRRPPKAGQRGNGAHP